MSFLASTSTTSATTSMVVVPKGLTKLDLLASSGESLITTKVRLGLLLGQVCLTHKQLVRSLVLVFIIKSF